MLTLRSLVLLAVVPLLLSAQGIITARAGQGPTLTAPASVTPPDQKCVVEGHVTNSQTGAPVKRANVRLLRHNTGATPVPGMQGYAGSSEADGSFHFDGVEPGDYSLSGEHSGFLNTQFGATKPMRMGTRLTLLPAQKLSNLNMALIPQSVVSGKVLDEDGDPVQGVMVQALSERWMNGKLQYMPGSSGVTNDMGEYRIANLSPGKYYISSQPMNRMRGNEAPASPDKPDVRPVRTYYPDAISRDAAAPVTVRTAQDLPGMDIHLKSVQSYHVRGKVAGNLPEGGADRLSLNLTLRDDFIPMFFGGGTTVAKDGAFDLAGVAPGAYTLSLMAMNGRISGSAHQSLDVGSADVNGVVLAIVPPGTLRGAIQLESKPADGSAATTDLSRIRISVYTAERNFFSNPPTILVKSDGTFSAEDVNPGKYFVHVASLPDGSYLKSIQFGRQDVYGKELDLSQGATGDLHVVLRYGVAALSGTVQLPDSAPSTPESASATQPAARPGVSLVLLPEVVNEDGSGSSFGSSDQNGTFHFEHVRPGRYSAFAFEEFDMAQWQNPAVRKQFDSRGTDVDLKENDKKQIQLTVISSADVHQALANLGLESQ